MSINYCITKLPTVHLTVVTFFTLISLFCGERFLLWFTMDKIDWCLIIYIRLTNIRQLTFIKKYNSLEQHFRARKREEMLKIKNNITTFCTCIHFAIK